MEPLSTMESAPAIPSPMSKASVLGYRSWIICVYNLIASHLRKPSSRNANFKLTEPRTYDLCVTNEPVPELGVEKEPNPAPTQIPEPESHHPYLHPQPHTYIQEVPVVVALASCCWTYLWHPTWPLCGADSCRTCFWAPTLPLCGAHLLELPSGPPTLLPCEACSCWTCLWPLHDPNVVLIVVGLASGSPAWPHVVLVVVGLPPGLAWLLYLAEAP